MKQDITEGADYYKFMNLIDKKVESVKSNLNYKIFKEDIEVLKSANSGAGLSAITANVWLKQICNLSQIELKSYVDCYKPGLLNPYLAENSRNNVEELEI